MQLPLAVATQPLVPAEPEALPMPSHWPWQPLASPPTKASAAQAAAWEGCVKSRRGREMVEMRRLRRGIIVGCLLRWGDFCQGLWFGYERSSNRLCLRNFRHCLVEFTGLATDSATYIVLCGEKWSVKDVTHVPVRTRTRSAADSTACQCALFLQAGIWTIK
jgi:hypothetical protein